MGLRYDEEAGQIELSNRVLVEDDASAIGQPEGVAERAWFEVLEVGLRIRKELVLDDGRASAAWLTWCGVEPENNEVPLWLSVKGVDVVRPPTKYAEPQCKHYYNWFVVELPVGALRTASNTVDMWVESGAPSWQVMVAADSELLCGSEPPRQRSGEVERAGMVGRVGNRMAWVRGGRSMANTVFA
jgi:hypothetical protein